MESRIQELTNKLLNEGVEKGKAEADKIVLAAREEAANIVAEAKRQAEEVLAAARKDADVLGVNTRAELKMYAAQAVGALKTDVANVLTDAAVKDVVKGVVADKDFMNQFVLKMAEKWGAQEDIVISTDDAAKLKALFAAKAKELLDNGVRIEEVHGQKALFSIQPADGSYKVNFGDEEFENYFKSFLRPQLVEMLF